MSSCSKAPRGLFVHLRVGRIFTATSISPSSSPRQCPDRYAIRAGRNLPDKEFRYLRTVIVTAAVHWGFGLGREARPLTFQHWAGVSPYTSGFPFAETCVFVKQSPGPARCGLPQPAGARPGTAARRSFSRSYGAILPSSLARNHSSTWRYLPSPTCVGMRYGRWMNSRPGVFLPEQVHANRFDCRRRFRRPLRLIAGSLNPRRRLRAGDGPCPMGPLALPTRVAPAAQMRIQRGRNMNRLSIAYAFRPRLRPA